MFRKLAGRTPRLLDEDRFRNYAVVAPFLPDTCELLFEVRSQKLNRQPGEICFPGGRVETGETPLEAGVRETVEELLVPQESIEIIAPLDIFLTPYYTRIVPYLARLKGYDGTFGRGEVQEIFTVPFEFFLRNEPQIHYNRVTTTPRNPTSIYDLLGVESYPWGGADYPVLFYQYGNRVIWGITARFVHNIVDLYREAQHMST